MHLPHSNLPSSDKFQLWSPTYKSFKGTRKLFYLLKKGFLKIIGDQNNQQIYRKMADAKTTNVLSISSSNYLICRSLYVEYWIVLRNIFFFQLRKEKFLEVWKSKLLACLKLLGVGLSRWWKRFFEIESCAVYKVLRLCGHVY